MISFIPWQIKSSCRYFIILFHCAYPVLLQHAHYVAEGVDKHKWTPDRYLHSNAHRVWWFTCHLNYLYALAQHLSKRILPFDIQFTTSVKIFKYFQKKLDSCKYTTRHGLKAFEDLLSFNPFSLTNQVLILVSLHLCLQSE